MGTGATVSNPHGWKPGKPVQSSEGCLYPTWEREGIMADELLQQSEARSIGPFVFDLYLTMQGVSTHQEWSVDNENDLDLFRKEIQAVIAEHIGAAASYGEFSLHLHRSHEDDAKYHINAGKDIVQPNNPKK